MRHLAKSLVVLILTVFTHSQNGFADIVADHPRIWLTPSKLTELRARACYDNSGNEIEGSVPDDTWTDLKEEVDDHLNTNFYGNDGLNWDGSNDEDSDKRGICAQYLANFAMVYQVTKNPIYARAAVEKTLQFWGTPWTGYTLDTWIEYNNWYTVRFLVPGAALIFDWCYDQMTEGEGGERETFTKQLDRWAYKITHEITNADWAWEDSSNNYWYGYMWALTSTGYALYGHDDDASAYIDYAKNTMIPEAFNEVNDEQLKWPRCFGQSWCHEYGHSKGGEWSEGNNYGGTDTGCFAQTLFALKSAENIDLFSDTDFFEEYIQMKMHSQLPGTENIVVAGDGGSTDPDRAVERLAIRAVLEKYPDSNIAKYGQKWLLDYSDLPDQKLFINFAFYDKNLAALDYSGINKTYFAQGMQIQTYRTNWTDSSLWLYMRFSPRSSDHTYDGQGGHFNIWKNGWLIRNHNGGVYVPTDARHNVVYLPPDGDKRMYWGNPLILHRENTDDYLYYAGDATDVFSTNCDNRSCNVDLNQRSFFYIKDNYLVIYDRVNTENASDTKAWQVFFDGLPTVDDANDIASYANENSKIFVKTLLPEDPSISIEAECYTDSCRDYDYRERVTYKSDQNYNNFLHAIEVKDGNVSMSDSVLIESTTGNMVGAQIGNYIVMFSENLSEISETEYQVVIAGENIHYITGLKPNTTYYMNVSESGNVMINDEVNALPDDGETITLVSSSEGVISSEKSSGGSGVRPLVSGGCSINDAKSKMGLVLIAFIVISAVLLRVCRKRFHKMY